RLPPPSSLFSWMPLHDFVLRWARAGTLAYPGLGVRDAISQTIADQMSILGSIPTIQTLQVAADNDLKTFILQGAQSTSLSLNVPYNDIGPCTDSSEVIHIRDAHFPALEYIQHGNFTDTYTLWEVEGTIEYFDIYPRGASVKLEGET